MQEFKVNFELSLIVTKLAVQMQVSESRKSLIIRTILRYRSLIAQLGLLTRQAYLALERSPPFEADNGDISKGLASMPESGRGLVTQHYYATKTSNY